MPNRDINTQNQTKTFLTFSNLPRNLVPRFLTFLGLCMRPFQNGALLSQPNSTSTGVGDDLKKKGKQLIIFFEKLE
jgi:hypothetical protein